MVDGTYKTASTPFGYDYVDGKLQINPQKAEIVKQIFSWYANGIGVEEISARLNRNGVPAPFGKCWRTPRILEILANEKYVGDTLLQKSFMTDTLPFRQTANRGEKPQYYISSTHRPIIERSLFEEVQSLIKSRKPNNDFNPQPSVFRRKIKCVCGGTFRRKKNGEKIYWVCRNHDRSAANCNIRQIREDEFRMAFVRLWNKLQAHYKAILAPMLRQLETLSEREKSGNTQLAELRKEISEIKQQAYLLTMLNSQGTLDGAYFTVRNQELDRKLLTAQKQLHANLDDKDGERLDELRKLIGIFERAEPITDFDEIKFGMIVEKITVLSESEMRFDLIGGVGFTERIVRG